MAMPDGFTVTREGTTTIAMPTEMAEVLKTFLGHLCRKDFTQNLSYRSAMPEETQVVTGAVYEALNSTP